MVTGCRLVLHIAGKVPGGGVVEGVPTGKLPGGVIAGEFTGGECGVPISVSISSSSPSLSSNQV